MLFRISHALLTLNIAVTTRLQFSSCQQCISPAAALQTTPRHILPSSNWGWRKHPGEPTPSSCKREIELARTVGAPSFWPSNGEVSFLVATCASSGAGVVGLGPPAYPVAAAAQQPDLRLRPSSPLWHVDLDLLAQLIHRSQLEKPLARLLHHRLVQFFIYLRLEQLLLHLRQA